MITKKKQNPATIFIFIVLILMTIDAFSRAGGGGGGGSGGGDGGGIFQIILILLYLPFPWNVITIGALILLGYLFRKKTKQASVLNKVPTATNLKADPAFLKYKQTNPGFDENAFLVKVRTAFMAIQQAWMEQETKKIRKFISDGVYQRFNVQFIMMKKLQQSNQLSQIEIHSAVVAGFRNDGDFNVLDVAIHASMKDTFVSKRFPKLNSGGYDSFVEYWTFIRKAGAIKGGDLYNDIHCPQCGAELSEIEGETGTCPYCKTVINTGEFDWVLCEITQADDFTFSQSMAHKESNLYQKIQKISGHDKGFSVQWLEDKASNAFLQWEIAKALRNPLLARRFSNSESYEKLVAETEGAWVVLFNRLFLNDVTLISAWNDDKSNYLGFFIRKSYQRLQMKKENPEELDAIIDPVVRTQSQVIVLTRTLNAAPPKGLLYAHQCPSCGGTLSDTIDIKCPFCGAEVNSPDFEWIVEGVYSLGQYKLRMEGAEPDEIAEMGVGKVDDLLDVRDYAFNNVLIMMASDGVFAAEEEQFARSLAKKLGYNPSKIGPAIEMAKNKKLVLRMPDDPKKHGKIVRLMEKAAMSDNQVVQAETDLLNYMHQNFGS
ncbi:MAG: hypothetical protein CVU11_07265 [Bacteroidetes bacterium HGW-Bacteroidetes-6]|jgi:rubrerythrin|nr:MAG: hypothetical protein CVU11_07265 [Bacteroidetes bacterium HGW-Bacteroidetes-6]